MIPQFELDRALARWKARRTGQDVATTPGPQSYGARPAAPEGEVADTSSGVIPLGDSEYETE
jgi:hypothetical protein